MAAPCSKEHRDLDRKSGLDVLNMSFLPAVVFENSELVGHHQPVEITGLTPFSLYGSHVTNVLAMIKISFDSLHA